MVIKFDLDSFFQSEIRDRILSKINLLRNERELIVEEKHENDKLGGDLLEALESLASPSEADKVYKYVQEVEQITKLSVGLHIRLSKVMGMIERQRRGSTSFSDSPREQVCKGIPLGVGAVEWIS